MTVNKRPWPLPQAGSNFQVDSDRCLNGPRRTLVLSLLGGGATAACPLWAQGQTPAPIATAAPPAWPTRPVKVIIPSPPFGGSDTLFHPLAVAFAQITGQALVPEYHGGLGGTRGASVAARASANGYTLFMGGIAHTIAPALRPPLDYLLDTDFVPLALLATMPQVLVVNPAQHPGNFESFFGKLQVYPGRYSYGSAGNGTSLHMAGELFRRQTRTHINHVSMRSDGQALTELVAGNVDMVFDSLASAAPHIRAGRIKALMVSGAQRNPAIPKVPCAAELGLSGFNVGTWHGLWAPKGLPTDVRARIIEVVQNLSETQAIQVAWMDAGAEFPAITGAAFGDFVDAEMRRWAAVVKAQKIQMD